MTTELLNSPGGVYLHDRPTIGTAIVVEGRASIVRGVRRLTAEMAEDFDMFEFSDFGGWEVSLGAARCAEGG